MQCARHIRHVNKTKRDCKVPKAGTEMADGNPLLRISSRAALREAHREGYNLFIEPAQLANVISDDRRHDALQASEE